MLGLVLEGGGVKGAYQVGAVQALYEYGYKFDGFVGTSIGAINSALLVQGNWDKLIQMWDNMVMNNFLEANNDAILRALNKKIDKEVIVSLGKIVSNLGEFVEKNTEKSHAFLKEFIDEEAIRKSPYDFGLVTFSLPDFEPRYFMKEDIPKGEICDYIIASASYPVFKTQQLSGYNGKVFIDGGVYDNMPINLLAAKGYKDIFVIRTRARRYRRKLLYDDLKLSYIVPSEKLSTAMNFTLENIEHYKKLGYFDTQRLLLHLKSKRYCIETLTDNEFYDKMSFIPDMVFEDCLNHLQRKIVKKDTNLKNVCEIIRRALNLKAEEDDFTVFIYFLEIIAANFKVEKFKIYDFIGFYDAIMQTAYNLCKSEPNIVEILKGKRNIKSTFKLIFVNLYNSYFFNKLV